jgi:hypothetical protein
LAGEAAEWTARARARAVLRVRATAVAVALLPAAVALVIAAVGAGLPGAARWALLGAAALVLAAAGAVAGVLAWARPAVSPTVPVTEAAAPGLHRLVAELAARLGVPAPSALALTPDCDSWLEDRAHLSRRAGGERGTASPADDARAGDARTGDARAGDARRPRRAPLAPVLVIGSPFVWWMRVGELRALLAPVVAGTAAAAEPRIAAARRFVRGLDAALAVAAGPGRAPHRLIRLVTLPWRALLDRVARTLLGACRQPAAEMERAVAAAASARAQEVDYGLRIVAQQQVGLACAGWDRLLARVALPAWRTGRWPDRLDAGVVAALTELSRRDRLAEGFETRLADPAASELLTEPGTVDAAASLLAARLFHGGPARPGPGWLPVDWEGYPREVVARIWRGDAARLIRVLDELGPPLPTAELPTPQRQLAGGPAQARWAATARRTARATSLAGVLERLAATDTDTLADRIGALVARAAHEEQPAPAPGDPALPVVPLLPPRTGRDLLAEHLTAVVCCAAVDTAGARPGLDWLDGPVLLMDGGPRRADLTEPVLRLVEQGDQGPLRSWLTAAGVRTDVPVRVA